MVKSRYIGDKRIPPLIGILTMGIFSPLRTWVDEFIPKKYGNVMGVDRLDSTLSRTYEFPT